jgi:hypothetical protein
MRLDKLAVASCLNELENADALQLAQSFLHAQGTLPVSEKPILVKASEALRLWETRLKNTEFTHQPISGAESLVKNLRNMPPNQLLEQFGFMNEKMAGNFFFKDEGKKVVGFILVNKSVSAGESLAM